MNPLKSMLAALFLAAWVTCAMAEDNPLHNPINGLDVDANSRIQARDALLIIGHLLQSDGSGTVADPLVATPDPASFYGDTTNDGLVTHRDAFMVMGYLTSTVPEPGTFVLGVLGLPALAVYAWRRRRATAQAGR